MSCKPPNRIDGAKKIAVISASNTRAPILITANFVSYSSVIGTNSLNLLAVTGQSAVYVDMKPGLDTYQLSLFKSDLTPYNPGKEMVIICHVA